jgi:hypothetical protein
MAIGDVLVAAAAATMNHVVELGTTRIAVVLPDHRIRISEEEEETGEVVAVAAVEIIAIRRLPIQKEVIGEMLRRQLVLHHHPESALVYN